MKKSKEITLTLLSSMALTVMSCSKEEEKKPNPYDEYSYYGKANEPGMVYSSYGSGILTWYLMSRMFSNQYGAMGAGRYYASRPGFFRQSAPATGGYASAARRGGFGKIGAARSARS